MKKVKSLFFFYYLHLMQETLQEQRHFSPPFMNTLVLNYMLKSCDYRVTHLFCSNITDWRGQKCVWKRRACQCFFGPGGENSIPKSLRSFQVGKVMGGSVSRLLCGHCKTGEGKKELQPMLYTSPSHPFWQAALFNTSICLQLRVHIIPISTSHKHLIRCVILV